VPHEGARLGSGVWKSSFLWRSYVIHFSLVGIAVLVGGWKGALCAMGIGVILLYWSTRSVFSPLAKIARAAQAMASGSYGHRLSAGEFDEAAISSLGQALNSISGDLAQRLNAIAHDRDRLETVLAATLEGVIALDRDGQVALMNQAAQRLLAITPESAVGRPLQETCSNPSLVDLAREAVEANELKKSELKEGGKLLEVYATPLKGRTGVVLVVHDVTEVRRLEVVRRDFVANVSHELKTPLTSIRAYLETLLEGGAILEPENNVRFLKKIETHVGRLTALIADLLSLSKIESGDAFSHRQEVNLGELVLNSFHRLSPNAEQKDLTVKLDLPVEPLLALGDPEAFHQIFDNLIDNAIKYTEPGGKIEIVARSNGKHVRVEVKDTGVGIPKEDLPRIFERFYRVDKARSRELGGTGLGLSIVKHLLQALQGEIQVESQVGVGSRFTVQFPAV
jgi:two-component system phosphate regulon sensor histidine kinase PhoR